MNEGDAVSVNDLELESTEINWQRVEIPKTYCYWCDKENDATSVWIGATHEVKLLHELCVQKIEWIVRTFGLFSARPC